MKRVIIESPYAGDVARNVTYLHRCMRDSLARGEAPFASHLLYTTVLDDLDHDEREMGIEAGLTWAFLADCAAVYGDYGYSAGMLRGIARHETNRLLIIYRKIGLNP